MQTAGRNLIAIMPFLFGVGFIAPLLVQTGLAARAAAPLHVDPLWLALATGGCWGLLATVRGRWL